MKVDTRLILIVFVLLCLIHLGKNKEHGNTASAIRSNHSIKPQCGLFYYEVKIEKGYRGNHGHITVGICSDYCRLDRMPGM